LENITIFILIYCSIRVPRLKDIYHLSLVCNVWATSYISTPFIVPVVDERRSPLLLHTCLGSVLNPTERYRVVLDDIASILHTSSGRVRKMYHGLST